MSKHNIRRGQANGRFPSKANGAPVVGQTSVVAANSGEDKSSPNMMNLAICVGGIYASLCDMASISVVPNKC